MPANEYDLLTNSAEREEHGDGWRPELVAAVSNAEALLALTAARLPTD